MGLGSNLINFKTYKILKMPAFTTRFLSKIAESNQDSLNYCANLVRQHDYENFLATLLLTKAVRSPTLVVRAFNVEVARIQDQTTDSQTAAFRLQFWNDTLKLLYKNDQTLKNIPANPIAQELFKVCNSCKLPKRYLERLIAARGNILKSKHFQSLEDLEKYAEDSVSSIYYLILSISDVTNVHADHAASHLGKAQGIVNILRSVHVASYHKTVTLPMNTLMKYGISQENVLRGIDNENMRNVAFEIATRANSHLEKARAIDVPKKTKQIFLPAVAVNAYLKKLQKCNFNLYDKSLQLGNSTLPLNLYYNRLMNKY
ncbi:NADH dehydrogenase (ubiquinone) complex I, assembly factor 6 [Bombyx mandarina]|uniref:15-cis-phytoene synthase n=1 Tax=Bombyx mandarina TaxID=7092 RepID=A0A6J2KAL6_BOMMA|nr:NADH dehydrogenase (ubiquinone) complex I, assembly factor 6 [Bombyx mandarina]